MKRVVHRGRTLVSLTAASGLAAGAIALTGAYGGASHAAASAGDCAPTISVDEIAEGDAVNGLTVAKGTTPAPFAGSVVGVLENGIAPGMDMIIMDLDSPDIDKAGGIWSGMSGSPVYADDGRLIGAVAYGLSYGNSKIAGVTPIEAMKQIGTGYEVPDEVGVPAPVAKSIAASGEVTVKQARRGLSQLEVPVVVSGVDAAKLKKLSRLKGKQARKYVRGLEGVSAGSASAAAGPETVVAGGNLGATYSYGDITQGGVGTVTTVCDGHVLGFGHTMGMTGRTNLSLHPATALYVQEDHLGSPFKVANFGAPVGIIDQDRRAGIAGLLGAAPKGMKVNVDAKYRSRSHEGETTVTVDSSYQRAFTTLLQVDASFERAIDAWVPGQALLGWTIKGTENGKPFTLSSTNRHLGYEDIGWEAGYELADLIWILEDLDGVTLTSVEAQGEADLDSTQLRMQFVQQRRGGKWVVVKKGSTVKAKAGKVLKFRAALKNNDGITYAPFTVKVPKAKGKVVRTRVVGGSQYWASGNLNSIKGVKKYLADSARNDQVVATAYVPTEGKGNRPKVRTTLSKPQSAVVRGAKNFKIRVK